MSVLIIFCVCFGPNGHNTFKAFKDNLEVKIITPFDNEAFINILVLLST